MAITLADIERMYAPQSMNSMRQMGIGVNQDIFKPYDPTVMERQDQARQVTEDNEYKLERQRKERDFEDTFQQIAEERQATNGTVTMDDLLEIRAEAGIATGNFTEVMKAQDLREKRKNEEAENRNRDIDKLLNMTSQFGPDQTANIAALKGMETHGLDFDAAYNARMQTELHRKNKLYPQRTTGDASNTPTASHMNVLRQAYEEGGQELVNQMADSMQIEPIQFPAQRLPAVPESRLMMQAALMASENPDPQIIAALMATLGRPHTQQEIDVILGKGQQDAQAIEMGQVSAAAKPPDVANGNGRVTVVRRKEPKKETDVNMREILRNNYSSRY